MSYTTLVYESPYNSGAVFNWSGTIFSSTNSGLTYIGYPTTLLTQVPGNNQLIRIRIGNIVKNILESVFIDCHNLSSVTFESVSQVETIGDVVFQNCSSLISIAIPKSVTSIGFSAFFNCFQLKAVTFETVSQVETIGYDAFLGCSFATIIIPNSVQSIGNDAFQDCNQLSTVYISNDEAQKLGFSSSNITVDTPNFYNAPKNIKLQMPSPYIDGVSPATGGANGGTRVTIVGSSFTNATSVKFGDNEATNVNVISDNIITCRSPPNDPGQVKIIVNNEVNSSNSVNFIYIINCFKEGSKILTNKGYIPVQDLRKGDLVKTVFSDFKKIEHIGYSKMHHNVNNIRSTDKLYRCSKSKYPELFEDLIITGGHSILIFDDFKDQEQKDKSIEVLGRICITEDHYRLPACVDDRTKIFEEEGVHTIWHFSLENTDNLKNYGVYANGLLVETASNRMMFEICGFTLID